MIKPNQQGNNRPGKSAALVYVVDDEPMLLELAMVILAPLGYQVQTYRDPEKGCHFECGAQAAIQRITSWVLKYQGRTPITSQQFNRSRGPRRFKFAGDGIFVLQPSEDGPTPCPMVRCYG